MMRLLFGCGDSKNKVPFVVLQWRSFVLSTSFYGSQRGDAKNCGGIISCVAVHQRHSFLWTESFVGVSMLANVKNKTVIGKLCSTFWGRNCLDPSSVLQISVAVDISWEICRTISCRDSKHVSLFPALCVANVCRTPDISKN